MSLAARLALQGGPDTRLAVTDGSRGLTVGELSHSTIQITEDMIRDGVALCLRTVPDFILAIAALDGRVSKILLLSPDLGRAEMQGLLQSAGITCLFTDRPDLADVGQPLICVTTNPPPPHDCETTWLMTTSGTTGTPKIVAHRLAGLAATVKSTAKETRPVWGLLYEPSRFAGLQVILQALLGHGCLVAPNRTLPVPEQLGILADAGCTHLSGTPSLWRKLLLSPASEKLALRQITLGGETADARVLTSLAALYPQARITQIYASTEAGVGFSSHDGKPGFPMACLEPKPGQPDFKIHDGELWARTGRVEALPTATDADGYFGTGDSVEVIDGRLLFRGRRDAVANVGGIKIRVEDVENIVRENEHVFDCQVALKPSPILGTVLTLQVVARNPDADHTQLRSDIGAWCRSRLPREACPVSTRIVASLDMNAAGKVWRRS
jgi:acyl-CoA synthetase (AMP-forming)/AMP-acid ligase II